MRTCPSVVLADGTSAALKDSRLLAAVPTSSSSPWSRYMCPHAAMLAPCFKPQATKLHNRNTQSLSPHSDPDDVICMPVLYTQG